MMEKNSEIVEFCEKFSAAKNGLQIRTLIVECPCGNSWGINLWDYDSAENIPARKFTCVCKNPSVKSTKPRF